MCRMGFEHQEQIKTMHLFLVAYSFDARMFLMPLKTLRLDPYATPLSINRSELRVEVTRNPAQI